MTRGVLLAVVAGVILAAASAEYREFHLHFGYEYVNVDCTEHLIMTVDGQFPGPQLEVYEGDEVAVMIHNELNSDAITIHFHGVTMTGTPEADGTAYISQCPIPPGGEYWHRFIADKPGMFWYHGHLALDADTGYGALIVHPKTKDYNYDEDGGVLFLGNHWHTSRWEQQQGLLSTPFRWVGNPESHIINGRGVLDCAAYPEGTCSEPCEPETKMLMPNKTYLFRLTNAAGLSTFTAGFTGGVKMTVVRTEVGLLKPFETDYLDLGNGESYHILITTPAEPTTFWFQAVMRFRTDTALPARVLFDTRPGGGEMPDLPTTEGFPENEDVEWSLDLQSKIRNKEDLNLEDKFDQHWRLVGSQNFVGDRLVWSVNNCTMKHPHTPYLVAHQYGIELETEARRRPEMYFDYTKTFAEQGLPNEAEECIPLINVKPNQVIRVILQNTPALNGAAEIHPWHIHGYNFRVLGHGMGRYRKKKDPANLNFVDPPVTSTVNLYPSGWVAVEFTADNPGFWAFHCHIHPHTWMGMGIVIGDTFGIPEVDLQQPICGDVTPQVVVDEL